jgi:hypothetical protein
MESLFLPKYFTYSPKAGEYDEEIRAAVEPIIRKWVKAGYRPHELEVIGNAAVSMTVCVEHMTKNAKMAIAERKNKTGE